MTDTAAFKRVFPRLAEGMEAFPRQEEKPYTLTTNYRGCDIYSQHRTFHSAAVMGYISQNNNGEMAKKISRDGKVIWDSDSPLGLRAYAENPDMYLGDTLYG